MNVYQICYSMIFYMNLHEFEISVFVKITLTLRDLADSVLMEK